MRLPDALMTVRGRWRGLILCLALLLLVGPPASSFPDEIIVAFGESFPPIVFRDADGRPTGADIAIWRLWSERTGIPVEFRLMKWSEALPALERGEVDVVDGVSRTPAREQDLDFSVAYGELRSYIYYDEKLGASLDLDDLKNHRTGVIDGTDMEEYLRRTMPQIELVEYGGPAELVAAARRDEIDAFIGVDLSADYHLDRQRDGDGDEITHGEDALAASLLHMAVREGNHEVLDLVNRGLAMITEKERRKIFKEWTGVGMAGPIDLEWIFWLGGSLLLTAVFLFTWNTVLRRRVAVATREVREKETRFRALIESSSDWIWEVDTNYVYTYVSPRVRDLLGYEPEEVIGKSPFDLMPGAEAERVREIVMPLMAEGKPLESVENRNLHRDGHTVLLESSGLPILDRRGRVKGYRGVDRDITERKSLEAQLHHSQKMEAIGQLAGGVAHDFNNQLQAILGFTHLLLGQEGFGAPARTHLNEVRKAAERAAVLTRQLLTFGRRETLKPRNLDLGALIRSMTEMLTRVLGERIELEVRTAAGLQAVRIDPGQVEQVVMNLCINARDAMPDGGMLAIETGNVRIDEARSGLEPGDYVELVVRDTGTGIDDAVLGHIFEPFYTTKGVGKGTGLGLATVYAIVDRHRGRVEVESRPGDGACFRVLLPANGEAVEVEDVPETPVPGRGTETILVAEDEQIVRELTVEVLSDAGYRLLVAVDGDEAVEVFTRHRDEISLVILDVVMPGRGGREVHDHVRAARPDLPVLFCSGYSYSALTKGQLPPGGGDLLQKPYTPAELLARVRKLTEEGQTP